MLLRKSIAEYLLNRTVTTDYDLVPVKYAGVRLYEIDGTHVVDEDGYLATTFYPNTEMTAFDFKGLLDTFVEMNPSKDERISYNTWRTFVRVSGNDKNYYTIILEPENHIGLTVTTPNGSKKYESFSVTPTFYGLTSEYFNLVPNINIRKEDTTIMSNYNNNTTSDTFTSKTVSVKKGNTFGNISMPNIDFGPITCGIAISPYGLAVYNGNSYLAYDAKSNKTIDVTGFTFDFPNMIYKMPVAANQIAAGDMVVHQGKVLYVTKVEDKNIEAIDVVASEAKTIIPVSNVFGFNFVTKIVSLVNIGNMQPNEDNPFGNIMPMMMLSSMMNNDEGSDMGKMVMLSMMMSGNSNPFANLFGQQ